MSEWLAKEKKNWTWLEQACRTRDLAPVWQVFNQAFSGINSHYQQLKGAVDEAAKANAIAALKNIFKTHYDKNKLIYSGIALGNFLAELSQKQSPTIAAWACACAMRMNIPFNTCEAMLGVVALSFFENEIHQQTAQEVTAHERMRQDWESKFQEFRNTLEEETNRHKSLNQHRSEQLEKQKKEFEVIIDEEQKKLDLFHKTYTEKVQMGAPRGYWQKKARSHRTMSWIFGTVSLVLGGSFFAALYNEIPALLNPPAGIANPEKWSPEYWRIAILILFGVLGLWCLRIFVRLFLSNVHLQTDAKERVTMVETYLAFVESGKAMEEKDRQLILSALFRPAATGVVKDEALPITALENLVKIGKQ